MLAKNFMLNDIAMEEMPSILQKILEQRETLKGKKILESLRNFPFDHENANFAEACLSGVRNYFEKKSGRMSYEEVLAVLVRANIINFVERGHVQNLWYLLLIALLPEEFRSLPKSVVVERIETEFIKFMEILGAIAGAGEDAIRDGVLKFLFKENREFTFSVFNMIEVLLGVEGEKILN
jgi:hypothetical protein